MFLNVLVPLAEEGLLWWLVTVTFVTVGGLGDIVFAAVVELWLGMCCFIMMVGAMLVEN